jgi:hypothetical protein
MPMTRKELILRAIDESSRTIKTCTQKPLAANASDDQRHCWQAIEACRENAQGRLDAFEAVLNAMNGQTKMLEYYGTH